MVPTLTLLQESHKLWGGRFKDLTNTALEKLNSSINLDKRMYSEDIEGSKAYSKILNRCNLLSTREADLICDGLEKIKLEWMKNEFILRDGDEDIHTANERRLKVIDAHYKRLNGVYPTYSEDAVITGKLLVNCD